MIEKLNALDVPSPFFPAERPADAPVEAQAARGEELEPGLLADLVDGPEQVQELPADRRVRLKGKFVEGARELVRGTVEGQFEEVRLELMVLALLDAHVRVAAADADGVAGKLQRH